MSEEKEVEILESNVRELLKTRQGKQVIWEILSYCDVYSSIPGKFEAGKRNVGLDIIQLLDDADPTLYAKLLLEKKEND